MSSNYSPVRVLQLALFLILLLTAGISRLVLNEPWLNIHLSVEAGTERVILTNSEVLNLSPELLSPVYLVSISDSAGEAVQVVAADLVEDPDLLGNLTAFREFLVRQSQLFTIKNSGLVTLTLQDSQGLVLSTTLPAQSRPLGSLPYTYWLQIIVAMGSFMVGAWVWSLRQNDWPARCFMLSGMAILLAAGSAALYSSRELALNSALLGWASVINFIGASGFGAAMVGLFLLYPKVVMGGRKIATLVCVLFALGLYHSLERLALVPQLDPELYLSPLIIMVEMILIIFFVAVQWYLTKGDPLSRAVLRWLGLSIIICSGFFVLLYYIPLLINKPLLISQAHSFIVFLLIYIGMGLGLRRYKLFDLGAWSFRIMFYIVAILGFVVLDMCFLSLLHFSTSTSTAISLLCIGFAYLPLREWLWRKSIGRNKREEQDWLTAVMSIPFSATPAQSRQKWQQLLERVFDPLQIDTVTQTNNEIALEREGLALVLPATDTVQALCLQYSKGGKSLFSSEDLKFARQLLQLLRHAEHSKAAYEEGKQQERQRIAKDLHDDIGAQLLTTLHSTDLNKAQNNIRKTLGDLRAVVAGLIGKQTVLTDLISALRFEASSRLEECHLNVAWPLTALDESAVLVDYRFAKNLTSIVRELVSNVIKHSQATSVEITTELLGDVLYLKFTDNGCGIGEASTAGNGLGNMKERISALGGTIEFANVQPGLQISIRAQIHPVAG